MAGNAQDGKPGIAWAKIWDDKLEKFEAIEQGQAPRPVISAERIAKALYAGAPAELQDDAGTAIVFTMDHRGAVLDPVTVDGDLDLTALNYGKPIDLSLCEFKGTVTLKNARTGALDFDRSSFERIDAGGLKTEGDIRLNAGTIARRLDFDMAEINGDVRAVGLRINPGDDDPGALGALFAQQARIQGSVFLRDGFTADGEVDFNGATIGGQFDCVGGIFRNQATEKNQATVALWCQNIDVKQSVFLRDFFTAEGEVDFNGATIGGQFDCSGGIFRNPATEKNPFAVALRCQGIDVKQSVFLRDFFTADGEVDFNGATIGGQFDCVGGIFRNPATEKNQATVALECQNIDVKQDVFLRDGFTAEGEVSFPGAKVHGDLFVGPGFTLKGSLILHGTSVQALYLRQHLKPSRDGMTIHVDGLKYQRIHTRQEVMRALIEASSPYSPQPYVQLARVLTDMGQQNQAREVRFALARRENARARVAGVMIWPLLRTWHIILWMTAGHGVWPFRALLFIFALWFCGVLVFAGAYDRHLILPSPDKVAEGSDAYARTGATPPTYIAFDPWIYSLDVLLPIIDLQQEGYWLPFAPEQRPNPLTPPPKLSATGQVAVDLGGTLAIWLGDGIAAAAGATDMGLDWLAGQAGLPFLQDSTHASDAVAAMGGWLEAFSAWAIPRVWYWFEVLAGWSLISIAIAGFTGLLSRREDGSV